MSVVFPLPRNPVTRVTGVLDKGDEEVGIERIERPPRQPLGLEPDRAQVFDHRRSSCPVAEDVDAAGPLVEPEAEVGQHAIQEPQTECPSAPVTPLLGPAFVEENAAEAAHLWSGFYQRTRRC